MNLKYSRQVGLLRINKDLQLTFLEFKLGLDLQQMMHLK